MNFKLLHRLSFIYNQNIKKSPLKSPHNHTLKNYDPNANLHIINKEIYCKYHRIR